MSVILSGHGDSYVDLMSTVVIMMYVEESAQVCMWGRCSDLIKRECGGIYCGVGWRCVVKYKMYRFSRWSFDFWFC